MLCLTCAVLLTSVSVIAQPAPPRYEDSEIELRLRAEGEGADPLPAGGYHLAVRGAPVIGLPAATLCPEWLPGGNLPLLDDRGPLAGVPAKVLERLSDEAGEWHYTRVDLTAAYADRVSRYLRHTLFVAPDLAVVYDELAAQAPVQPRFLIQAPGSFSWDEEWTRYELKTARAGATLQFLTVPTARLELGFKQWAGCGDGAGADGQPAGWWNLEARPTEAQTHLELLTIITPHAAGQRRRMVYFKPLESVNAVGARIHRDNRPTLVAFRRFGMDGPANLTGFPFERAVGVHVTRPRSGATVAGRE